jgi:hypothetical protein
LSRYNQGTYIPKNPQKYAGDVSKIYYRSSWEKLFMCWCDFTDAVVKWSSEEIVIPYLFTVDNKMHRYFPDFHIEIEKNGIIEKFLIEIKPSKDMQIKATKNQKRLVENAITVEQNRCKWEAAQKFCKENGLIFKVLTEKDLPV